MGHDGHEDWFRHDAHEAAPQDEHGGHVQTGALSITLLVTMFGVIALILLLVMYFQSYTGKLRAENVEGTKIAEGYMTYRSTTMSQLNGEPAWANRAEGTVRIPIDRAMDAVVEQYERYPKASAGAGAGAGVAESPLVWSDVPADELASEN